MRKGRSVAAISPGLLVLVLAGCHSPRPSRSVPRPKIAAQHSVLPTAQFHDTSGKAGLSFSWKHHITGPWDNRQSFGCGCAFLDYDNDGWMDIFLVGRPRCALFHNNHDGTFTDVSARMGLTEEGEWTGVAVGDYDNDGYDDIYVSGYHCAMLLHNNAGRSFTERSRQAGLIENQWGSLCAFFDADGDGRLDLLVGHYVVTGGSYPRFCPDPRGALSGCPPQVYPPQFPKLYHNNGDGTFTDVTARSGLGLAHGKALAVQFADYDNDGKLDFYIANDGMPGDMYHNIGGGRYENVSMRQGTAFGSNGDAQAGMGVDFADYDRDGWLDMVVSAFQNETFSLYHNRQHDFSLVSAQAGLGMTRGYLGFGLKFIDYDNDGWPDLVFANGHVYNNVNSAYPEVTFKQPMLLFHNDHGHFVRVTDAGPGFTQKILGRGLAVGDIRNNGQQEILAVDFDGHPVLLENERPTHNHWLGIKLRGVKCNRDGYGARVAVRWPGGQSFADCTAAGSYLSSSDPRLHFGLGAVARITRVTVHWPDSRSTQLCDVPADRYVTVSEDSKGGAFNCGSAGSVPGYSR